jgi:GNAT superfamily N-acetyltransferase
MIYGNYILIWIQELLRITIKHIESSNKYISSNQSILRGICMVRQAYEHDIPIIEEILLNAVKWMSERGLQNQWNQSNVKWLNLSKSFTINNLYIAYENEIPTACMALTDYDPTYWPDIPKGNSLYIHKLAVNRAFAGRGYSIELINFAKGLAFNNSIKTIRLNCNRHRSNLRALYEKSGFICVEEKTYNDYDTALYLFMLPKDTGV